MNKIFSRKFLITVWSVALSTYMIVTNKTDFIPVLYVLLAIPASYNGINYLQKKNTNGGS